jgi:KTSC domain
MSTESKNLAPAAFSERQRPPIPLETVESNQVGAIGYDEATQTLAVQFKRGARAIYHYPNVTRATYEAFRGAESIGTYFGQHLKMLPFEKFPSEDAATAA